MLFAFAVRAQDVQHALSIICMVKDLRVVETSEPQDVDVHAEPRTRGEPGLGKGLDDA